jgi:hypothetical protein
MTDQVIGQFHALLEQCKAANISTEELFAFSLALETKSFVEEQNRIGPKEGIKSYSEAAEENFDAVRDDDDWLANLFSTVADCLERILLDEGKTMKDIP